MSASRTAKRTARRPATIATGIALASVLMLVALAPHVTATGHPEPEVPDGPSWEVEIHITDDFAVTTKDPEGHLTHINTTNGESITWDVTIDDTAIEIEVIVDKDAFDVERAKQIVATIESPITAFPLFHEYPNERIWENAGGSRIYHYNETDTDYVLRLVIPPTDDGPVEGTFALTRDVTATTFTVGEPSNIQTYGFFIETTTTELCVADIEFRPAGSDEDWVLKGTTVHHYNQSFPVKGMSAGTEYEYRFKFRDWAENEIISELYTFSTPEPVEVAGPTITFLEPSAGAVLDGGPVTIVAKITNDGAEVPKDKLRIFFDLEAQPEHNFTYALGEVRFTTPDDLAHGPHVISIEATNPEGGKSTARLQFEIGGALPTPSPTLLLGLVAVLALTLRRRP